MSAALDVVHRALDAAPAPRCFFVRNDDAGWSAPALDRLLAVAANAGAVIDLAVIPAALTDDQSTDLRRYARDGVVRAHQHGFAHVNHEPTGRKCEFGPARGAAHQRADIRFGRRRLLDLLGDAVDPIFTPPWNRCTQATADALHEEGFVALSRDRTAERLDPHSLVELPITADWGKHNPAAALASLAEQIAGEAGPIGIMTHHATLDEVQLIELGALLALLTHHPNARQTTMGALVKTMSGRSGVAPIKEFPA